MNERPAISLIINTDGRARSLELALSSLRYLKYSKFEVCVVHGPTPDGTAELLESWRTGIKVAACPEKNLSKSRNIGIALAAGDIVAFIDDDAIPEPEWLDDIAGAYAQPDVGASGGFVYDHTGTEFQWRYGTIDRLARADLSWTRPPLNSTFHFRTTSSICSAPTALCVGRPRLRLADSTRNSTISSTRPTSYAGSMTPVEDRAARGRVRPPQISGEPSPNETRVVNAWYSIIKNKIYFSILNARSHHTLEKAIEEALAYIGGHRRPYGMGGRRRAAWRARSGALRG